MLLSAMTRFFGYILTVDAFWLMGEPQESGCILWKGNVSPQGYGRMGPTLTGTSYAHRSAWIITHGPIPPGQTVDHTCHSLTACYLGRICPHRRCINPDHLRLLPKGENSSLRQRTDVCPKGHPRRTLPSGQRYCPACTKAATEAWLAKDGNREKQNARRNMRR